MSEPTTGADRLRERLAEVRGEHGWARYVEDDVLIAWLRPAAVTPDDDGPGQAAAPGSG